jgi:hypothetical protein
MRLALDVRGQRHLTKSIEFGQHIFRSVESHARVAFSIFFDHLGNKRGGLSGAIVKRNACAGSQTFAGSHHGPPSGMLGRLDKQYLNSGLASDLAAMKSGGNDARVVEHQHITGVKELR